MELKESVFERADQREIVHSIGKRRITVLQLCPPANGGEHAI
jgi:hypothetical protein